MQESHNIQITKSVSPKTQQDQKTDPGAWLSYSEDCTESCENMIVACLHHFSHYNLFNRHYIWKQKYWFAGGGNVRAEQHIHMDTVKVHNRFHENTFTNKNYNIDS